mgnify:CR=1 FL=1
MIDIKSDSRKVKPGDTFIAIRNVARDGHDYIENAINNGAKKIICEEGGFSVETVVVEDTRAYLNEYLYENYYPKFNDMKFIGVTGTNGKTTICYLIYQMLIDMGKKCAYIGTIGFYYPGYKKELNNTTPDTDLLYEMFLEAKEAGCEYVVMEVSSHALDMNRIYGIEFDEVAFTNLTQDHLDYHKTLDNYAKAKQLLFKRTRNKKIAVINKDDPNYELFMFNENNNITISDNDGDVKILDIKFSNLGTKFSFEYNGEVLETNINMVGRYNVYNYLTAFLLVKNLGFDTLDILKLNETLGAPKGRMEMIKYGTNSIFVDYAHTPDAVINVLKNSLEYKVGKVITIVGCGGDRDRTKRPIMGHAAEMYSDYVIYTSDNPRTEDPNDILNDILSGVEKDNHEVILDRKEAIIKGMSMLNDGDMLMILGKGHEDYQIIGKEKFHFSDQEIVLEYIKEHE